MQIMFLLIYSRGKKAAGFLIFWLLVLTSMGS